MERSSFETELRSITIEGLTQETTSLMIEKGI
jgi:hypothetical protein